MMPGEIQEKTQEKMPSSTWFPVHNSSCLLSVRLSDELLSAPLKVGAVGTIVCPTQVTVGHIEHRMNAGWVGGNKGSQALLAWPIERTARVAGLA